MLLLGSNSRHRLLESWPDSFLLRSNQRSSDDEVLSSLYAFFQSADTVITESTSSTSLPSVKRRRRDLSRRHLVGELMDDPHLATDLHGDALRGLARANYFSFSAKLLTAAILPLAKQHNERPLRILDVACGGADVTLAVANKLARAGVSASIIGCDVSDYAIEHARANQLQAAHVGAETVEFRRANALEDQLPKCDVAMCSLFMHHLTDDEAVTLLSRMAEATEHVLVNDLRRTRLGYCLAWTVCRLVTRSKIVHVDGPLSVESAFTVDEALATATQAGLHGAEVFTRWPERFLLQWSR